MTAASAGRRSDGGAADELEQRIEAVLGRLGLELVELERAGHSARPLLKLRIDRPDSEPGRGVTVDDCARASRQLEAELDVRDDLPSSYILEVSSPGVDRPIRKRADYERFVGHEISVRGYGPLATGSRRVEGTLLSVEGFGESERIRVKLTDGREVEIARSDIAKARLVFDWNELKSDK